MTGPEPDYRVLVVAPTGRDCLLICNLLGSKGIACAQTSTAEMARTELALGAGAVILAEEVLTLSEIAAWSSQIAQQPSWSDLPLILLTQGGEVDKESQSKLIIRQPLGNLMLLERPVRPETFVSTVQAALRSRHRQYEMRDSLAKLRITEEALRRTEKLAVAGRLAASIAHEINNPLSSVTNLLYLISTSSSLQAAKKHGEMAAGELARVSEIVTQTLRFHSGASKPASLHIPEIVDSALRFYGPRLSNRDIVVERDFRECPAIVGMAGELRQVILNLIGNALDAIGHSGRLKIRIRCVHEHRNGVRPGIRLTIADTGSGILPEIRSTLFEPFVSSKGNTGTGLGLWISQQIVRKHGGTIQVKSDSSSQSAGTAFSIFLPLDSTDLHAAENANDSGEEAERKCVSADSEAGIAVGTVRQLVS